MTALLVELVITCGSLAVVLAISNILGLVAVPWVFILLLLLVPSMIGAFILAVVIVHEMMSTPEERSKARSRRGLVRHYRNWGL